MQRNLKVILVAVMRGALTLLAALWIFLEEWVWDAMQACMAWLGKLPGLPSCAARIARPPPSAPMVAFLIPAAILLPLQPLPFCMITPRPALSCVTAFRTANIG